MRLTSDSCLEWEKSLPIPSFEFNKACDRSLKTHRLYKKPGNRMLYCSKCGYENEIEGVKHGDEECCQKCGVEAKVFYTRSNTNFDNHGYSSVVKMLRKDGNVIIHTLHQVQLVIKDLKEEIDVFLIEVNVLHETDLNNYKIGSEWTDNGWSMCWVPGRVQVNPKFGYNWFSNNDVTIETVYPKSIVEFLADTDLRYTCVGEALDAGLEFDIKKLQIARTRPYYEFLWKTGQRSLFKELFDLDSGHRNAKYMMKHYRKQMVASKPSFTKIPNIRELIALGMTPSIEMFNLACHTSAYVALENYSKVKELISIDKFVKYVTAHNASDYLYRDYINLMEKIGTPVNKKTAFPNDIKKAHDDATNKFNTIKQELEDKTYGVIYQELKKIEFMDHGLRIIVPKSLNEILQEGKDMNHCVGSYVDRVARGDTVILFIRQSNNPTEAFCTMEYQNGHIIQVRGKSNAKTTEQVDTFTKEWLEWTKQPKKKPKKQIQPVMQLQAINA